MNHVILALTMLLSVGFPTSSLAQRALSFRPQAANIVGTDQARTPIPFTRVWTQLAGELAIRRVQEKYVNLTLNLPQGFRTVLKNPPVIGYMSYAWADQLLRVVCTIDLSRSALLAGRFAIVLTVSEGSIGSTPVGTILGVSDFRVFLADGVSVMTADFRYTPGVFPEVLPTSFTITDQMVPDLFRTSRPGAVIAEHTFTSIQPPDGSHPIIYTVREEIPIR